MASTVPFDAYIPVGSFFFLLDNVNSLDDEISLLLERNDGWLNSRHVGPSSSVQSTDCPISPSAQGQLLRLPAFTCLVRPLMKQWVWFSLRTAAHGGTPLQAVCRIYVLPDDKYRRLVPRSDLKIRRDLQLLLNSLDYSAEAWHGEYNESRPRTTVHATRCPVHGGSNRCDADQNGSGALSLLQMFNTIPSPKPQADLVNDEAYQMAMDALASSKIGGLKSTLYSYQIRSAVVMLQRELHPGRVVDPRLFCVTDQDGRVWYYNDVNGEVLRTPRYYDGVQGGILAEEMGTGKTLICLALILATRAFPAEIPDVCRDRDGVSSGSAVSRHSIASLADMAAMVVTRQSVPWKLYLQGGCIDAGEYSNCVDVIKRNPATYVLPRFKVPREHSRSTNTVLAPSAPVTLSSCSLVVVPANLVRQWEQEIDKHTEGLNVIVVSGKQSVPSTADILEADILLFSIPRFEKLEQDRVITRNGSELQSPLASVHFKRVIVDEGHRLGNSKLGRKSNLLLVLDCLHVSTRWIVTGTPSTGLFGVDDEVHSSYSPASPHANNADSERTQPATQQPVLRIEKTVAAPSGALGTSSSLQERKDLERIGSMASLYLRVRPWANTILETSDTPADWAVYVMQPNHSSRSSGRRDCLRATLDSLIIRHRKSEIGDLLPPVVEKVVLLDGSFQDKLCLNLFSMMIIFNAVQSQRTDRDYFFHPSQRSALLQLLSNIRQSTFYGGYFYSTDEIGKALETAEKFLQDKKVPVSRDDEPLLREAIAFGKLARQNKLKLLADQYHEVPIYVKDFPGGTSFASAWSIDFISQLEQPSAAGASSAAVAKDVAVLTDDPLTCMAAPVVRVLQQFLQPCIDAPHSLQAMFNDGRFAQKGHETLIGQLQQQKEQSSAVPKGGRWKAAPTLAGNTSLGEESMHSASPLKRRTGSLGTPSRMESIPTPDELPADIDIAAPLAQAQIVSTASAKLSYLLDSIASHQQDEQMIVFYDNENTAFYLAEHLEILQIHHLIYARGITAERRAQYVATFNQQPYSKFRVLLMDISQAAFGLDMRSASRVYFISPLLNPQVEAQAIGRVRRISKKRQVSVETLVLRDSLDEVIVERRRKMTQAEHRRIKSILDDRPINEWMAHARIVPLPGGQIDGRDGEGFGLDGAAQMAPLQQPQFLFGRGFGRVEDPDEGLVADKRHAAFANTVVSKTHNNYGESSSTEHTSNSHSENGSADDAHPPNKKRKVLVRPQVRFA